ncbi:MAG: DUF418 domain-containing protein [Alkalilacustris sp.]
MPATAQPFPQPPGAGRLVTLDATRALALFGVLVVNMLTLSGLTYLTPEMRGVIHGPADRAVAYVLAVLVEGKALAAFSLMFGVSFTLLIGRMKARGEPWVWAYLRRLALLAGFGLLNAAFFFWGDILTTYAVLGLFLPLAALLPLKAVLGLAGLLMFGPPVVLALAGALPPAPLAEDQLPSLRAFQDGRIAVTVAHNWALFTGAVGDGGDRGLRAIRYSQLAALFLIGLAAGRAGVPGRLAENRVWLRRVALGLLAVGLAMEAARRSGLILTPQGVLLKTGDALVGMAYVALVALWLDGPRGAWARRALAPLGAMALTGYLMGGLLGQVVFYGWGLGQIARHGTLTVIAISGGIFSVLLAFAHLWMRAFRQGPWEWLWRVLTRLRWEPLRR